MEFNGDGQNLVDSNDYAGMRFYRGSTDISPASIVDQTGYSATGRNHAFYMCFIDTPAPGVYTYTAKAANSSSDDYRFETRNIFVYELM
jgi:hypothetical protein